MAFTSRSDVKLALRIPTAVTDSDDLIDSLIDEVHATILDDIGGGLIQALLTSYTQKFDINMEGFRGLRLPHWPVGEITSVLTGTNQAGAGTTVSASEYYVTDEGTLRLETSTGYWPTGKQNVQVTWPAGFATTVTRDYLSLALAERMTVCELFNTMGGAGKKSEKIGSYSYTNASLSDRGGDIYPSVAARIISRFRSPFAFDPVVP